MSTVLKLRFVLLETGLIVEVLANTLPQLSFTASNGLTITTGEDSLRIGYQSLELSRLLSATNFLATEGGGKSRFEYFKQALTEFAEHGFEEEKPLPRIEVDELGRYCFHSNSAFGSPWFFLDSSHIKLIQQVEGAVIPIYKPRRYKSTWTKDGEVTMAHIEASAGRAPVFIITMQDILDKVNKLRAGVESWVFEMVQDDTDESNGD